MSEGFCVVADCHIDTRGLRPDIPARDTLYPLEQAVQYCLEHDKPLVVAGDLFDKSLPPSRLVNQVVEILERVSLDGAGCWVIQGNHDKDPEYPWGCHAKGVKWLGLTPELVGGHALVGLDFLPAGLISQALTRIPVCDGLVMHQALRQGLGFDGSWNCDLDWVLADRVQNVWIGDLHRVYDELWSQDHRVRALYTGSQYMTTVDESPAPSFLDVGPVSRPHPAYTRVPLRARPVLHVELSGPDEVDPAIDRISTALVAQDDSLPEELRAPLILLRYSASLQNVAKVFRDLCKGGLGHVVELPFAPEGRICGTASISVRAEQGLTLPILLDRNLPQDRFPELNQFAKELVGCNSVEQARQVLSAWRTRLLGS